MRESREARESTSPRGAGRARRRLAAFGRLLLGAALWLSLGRLALDSAAGRRWLAEHLARRLAAVLGGPVRIEGLGGRLPLNGRVARLILADEAGPWLEASNLAWRAAWPETLRGPWGIDELSIKQAGWLRVPDYGPMRGAWHERLELPTASLRALRLDAVHLSPALAAPPWVAVISVRGRALADAWGASAVLRLECVPGGGSKEEPAAAAPCAIAEERGLQGLSINCGTGLDPADASSNVTLAVSVRLSPDWQASLHATPRNLACRLAGETVVPDILDLSVPCVRPCRTLRAQLSAAWRERPLTLSGQFARQAERAIHGTNVIVTLPGLTGSGSFLWQPRGWQAETGVRLSTPDVLSVLPGSVPLRVSALHASVRAARDAGGLSGAASFAAADCTSRWAQAGCLTGTVDLAPSGVLTAALEATGCASSEAQVEGVTGTVRRDRDGAIGFVGAFVGCRTRWGDLERIAGTGRVDRIEGETRFSFIGRVSGVSHPQASIADVTNLCLNVNERGDELDISIAADLLGAESPWGRAERATVSVAAVPRGSNACLWRVEATCAAEAGEAAGVAFADVSAALSGSNGQWRCAGHAAGLVHPRLPRLAVRQAQWAARATGVSSGGCFLVAERLEADFADRSLNLRLNGPVAIDLGQEACGWRGVDLELNGARLRSDGHVDTERLLATLDIQQVPPAWFWPRLAEVTREPLSARLELRGSPAAPRFELDASLRGLVLRHEDGVPLPPLDLSLRGSYDGARVFAVLEPSGWSVTEAQVSAEAPLALSLWPWRPLPRDVAALPWQVRVQTRFNIEELQPLVSFGGVDARGAVDIDVGLSGPLDTPRVTGSASLRDGYVEHAPTGTLLNNLHAAAIGEGACIELRESGAEDGDGGTLELGGRVRLDPAEKEPLALFLRTKGFTLWRNGASRVAIKGQAELVGPFDAPCVTGRLQVVDSAIRIDRFRSTTMTLPVEGLGDVEPVFASDPARQPQRLRLELDVTTTRPLPVEGRGLQSLWDLRTHIGGPVSMPCITGEAVMREGRFHFLGHTFTFSDSRLDLDGSWPPDPSLEVMAAAETGGMTVRLGASGSVTHPSLDLSSTPDYPEEEIVSRLLFGRGSEAISPFQAARLAYGLEVLRGGRTTLDLLDRGQFLIRADELEFEQDETTGQSAVIAGKRLTSRLYIRGEKGVGAAEDAVAVQYELLPSLILESETRSGLRQGVSLRWRKEF